MESKYPHDLAEYIMKVEFTAPEQLLMFWKMSFSKLRKIWKWRNYADSHLSKQTDAEGETKSFLPGLAR